MGHNKSKLQGLLLPAQSGKTGKAIDIIKQRFETISQLQGKTDVNIWISANNKLLVKQTESRMHNELCSSDDESDDDNDSDAIIQGEVFSWISGSKKNNVAVDTLTVQIMKGKVEMIVMCSNAIRIRYLVQLLESLDEFGAAFLKKINIWIDEADQSIRQWSKYSRVLNMPMIQHVTLVSATMDTIFKHPSIMGSLRVMKYPTTYPECYRRLKDAECIEMDIGASSPSEYVRHVLTAHPQLIQPGLRAFIPGDMSKQSHEEISNLLQLHGFAVIILNGTHKELRIPGETTIDLSPYLTVDEDEKSDPIEFNTVLSRMYIGNNLDKFPLAITGFICVERGITFQCPPDSTHNGFLFDYGIIPPISDKAEAYQAMARLFGNIGHFPTYKPCQIYSNTATFKKVRSQEEIAVNLARIMHESGREEATISDVKAAAHYETEKEWHTFGGEFTDRNEANALLRKHGCNRNLPPTTPAQIEKYMENGFEKSSSSNKLSILSYDQVSAAISRWSKLSAFDIKEDTTHAGRMIICYRDLNDPKSVVYIVRGVIKK